MLPEIAGVTVPKQKENKEIPLSLKVKLERKGKKILSCFASEPFVKMNNLYISISVVKQFS